MSTQTLLEIAAAATALLPIKHQPGVYLLLLTAANGEVFCYIGQSCHTLAHTESHLSSR
jgi:hypothetical protein